MLGVIVCVGFVSCCSMSISCVFPAIGEMLLTDPPYLDIQVPPCDIDNEPEDDRITCTRCPEHMVSPTGLECVCGPFYFLDTTQHTGFRECALCMDGVNCTDSGATVANLPLLPGYWRTSNTSIDVRTCFLPDACEWHTEIVAMNVTVGQRRMAVAVEQAVPCAENRYGALCAVRSRRCVPH